MSVKGLIFDFDGLIIDTEMPGCKAWAEVFNQYGHPFTIVNWQKTIGTGPTAYDPALHLFELTNGLVDPLESNEKAHQRIHDLMDLQPLLPGVLEFIQTAQQIGLPMAVASSSERSWVEGFLSKLHIIHFFPVVCTSDDVLHVKPDPELYTLAAMKLGVSPGDAVAFEDSPNGVKAAKSAGLYCIAIPNEITSLMDLSAADRIVDSFFDLDLDHLRNSDN